MQPFYLWWKRLSVGFNDRISCTSASLFMCSNDTFYSSRWCLRVHIHSTVIVTRKSCFVTKHASQPFDKNGIFCAVLTRQGKEAETRLSTALLSPPLERQQSNIKSLFCLGDCVQRQRQRRRATGWSPDSCCRPYGAIQSTSSCSLRESIAAADCAPLLGNDTRHNRA